MVCPGVDIFQYGRSLLRSEIYFYLLLCVYLAGVADAITRPIAGVEGWLYTPCPTDTLWGVFPRAGVTDAGTRGEPGIPGEPTREFCQSKFVTIVSKAHFLMLN